MIKVIFNLLISPLTISNNYLFNYLVTSLIGFIAFKIAFKVVGDIGFRGEMGSIMHWIIRFIVFLALWFICCCAFFLIKFIYHHILLVTLLTTFIFFIIMLRKISCKNKLNC